MEYLKPVSENLGGGGTAAINVDGGNVAFAAKNLNASFIVASVATFSRPTFYLPSKLVIEDSR